jgi:DUF1009 family protein
VHQQQHALLALDAQRAQAGRQAAHALVQLAVGQRALVVDEGGLVRARGVAGQQVLGEVEYLAGGGTTGHRSVGVLVCMVSPFGLCVV